MVIVEDSKTLFGSSKLPWARERISSKFIDSMGRILKRFTSPGLHYRSRVEE